MSNPAPHAVDSLAARAARGDVSATEQLIARWSGAIRRWTLASLGDVHRADDAAQDAVERLLRGLASYDPSRPFEPWLRRIVRNAATDQHRSRSRRREERWDERSAPSEPARSVAPDRALDLAEGARRAMQAFAVLTEGQREVLIAVDHDGHSVAEVARRLGVTPGTVRSQLCKGRRAVRRRLLARDPEIADLLEAP